MWLVIIVKDNKLLEFGFQKNESHVITFVSKDQSQISIILCSF